MKRLLFIPVCVLLFVFAASAQLLSWAPDFPKDNDNVTITMDASKGNQALLNYSNTNDVYVHVGVITSASSSSSDWKYVKFTWGTTTAAAQASYQGNSKWQYTITDIRTFFAVPGAETILRIAVLFRNGNGSIVQRNANEEDMYIPVYDNNLAVRFSLPLLQPLYNPVPEPVNRSTGESLAVTAISNQSSALKLYLNGAEIQTAAAATSISANTVLTVSGNNELVAEANNGTTIKKDTLRFFVAPGINIAPLPDGVRDGINYETGNTSVVLVLYAPGKNRVSLIGEFPGAAWTEQASYVMNKTPDGNYWWLRITGLTPGTEYAFQYLVDGTLKIAEPYAEKILDPSNDQYISAATYPNLKPYPASTTGMVSILQTNPPAYNWAVSNFTRPDKRNLVIYELLLRDFLEAHDWKTLKDTLSHLKTMGVNAIELMPFNEFEGNISWGYNGFQYFAADKYYGPRNRLKEFIDSCHVNGIAVIMDIVLNHTYGPSPLARLYWDAANNRPAANNPWYNPVQPHAFGFGEDFNHSSAATTYFFNRVLQHWLTEYKIDGFRVDFSKGLTQKASANDGAFSAYDATRISILNNYAATIRAIYPDAYIILEHFCDDAEEKELSDNGFMLWSNVWTQYQEASMGYLGNSNFSGGIHTTRGWTNPHLVGFMESHDEERIMYKNTKYGNSSGAYNIKEPATALKRAEMNAVFLLTIPGPKMIWQFGELGYDFSRCHLATNGEGGDCNTKTDPKPIRWDYKAETPRKRLYDIYSSLNKLRFHHWYKDVFIANNISLTNSLNGAVKWIILRSATDSSMICVVGNFDINAQNATFTFPAAGTWYDYLRGGTITATGGAQMLNLEPGQFHVFVNRNLTNAVITPVDNINPILNEFKVAVYPNPIQHGSILELDVPATGKVQADLFSSNGQWFSNIFSGDMLRGKRQLLLGDKINNLAAGVYVIQVRYAGRTVPVKVIVQ